jgi:hypothetical protein
MQRIDLTVKVSLMVIALCLGLIASRPLIDPPVTALAQPAKFDHVFIVSTMYLYKGVQGLLVLDRRNGNVWFIPKVNEVFQDPVFVVRMQFEKLDQAPR